VDRRLLRRGGMKSTVPYAAGSFLLLCAVVSASCGTSHSSGFDTGDGGLSDSPFPPDDANLPLGDGQGFGTGDDGGNSFGSSSGSSSGGTDGSAPQPTCKTLTRPCAMACTDFPTASVIDANTPMNAATYFNAADGAGAGPCLVDPQPGTLIPQNWLRPRFMVQPAAGQNLFQITLNSTRQANPYVIYTSSSSWTMPKKVWDALRGDSWGDVVNVKIRGVNTGGGAPTSVSGTFTIAPSLAGGSMIYWAAIGDKAASLDPTGVVLKPAMSWLEGFAPGDESVATTLTTDQVQLKLYRDGAATLKSGGAVECIGCHSAAPDGNSVTFIDTYPWPGSTASVAPVAQADGGFTNGQTPTWLTPGGEVVLSLPWLGATTFSKADWANEKVVVSSFGCGPVATAAGIYSQMNCQGQPNGGLMWGDLAAPGAGPSPADTPATVMQRALSTYGTSWGLIPRKGDPNGVEFPNWSHDGKTIVYVSSNAGTDGRLGTGTADLYSVPFNAKLGGTATPVPGASDPAAAEYYPAFSADDKYLAFVHAATQGGSGMYYNPYGEIYMVPFGGAATPTRLAANDPPACAAPVMKSPGVTNSWPKWSPDVESCADGNTYYWLVFSSTRQNISFNLANLQNDPVGPDGGKAFVPTSQLYITGVSVDGTGKITTYPALYMWNQPSTDSLHMPGNPQSNHTPIWETVHIPRPKPPVVN
jgi:hypothetical protein